MTKTDTPTHGNHDDRKQHGAAGKARGKARAQCDRRAVTDAGNALPATRASRSVTLELEQHVAAAAPAKPKPAKRRRPERRKAARKNRAARARNKPKRVPEFPNSPPAPEPQRCNEPVPAAAQAEPAAIATAEPTEHKDEQHQQPQTNGNGSGNGAAPTPPTGNGNGRAGLPVPTEEEIDKTAAETAEKLALCILAALVSENVLAGMSALFDELIQEKSHLLEDDDEEQDESWINDRHKRERELLDEAITDALEKYPDINAVNDLPAEDLPTNTDRDFVQDAQQLKEVLAKYPRQPIGAIQFEEKFSREQFQRMVRRDLKERFKRDTKYRKHVSDDVPGSDRRSYGRRGRTSSRGTFAKSDDFVHGGGLDALFTGGWMRVAKDRIDPWAWSHEFGTDRKTERKNWRQVFHIAEKDGHVSPLEIPREKLAGRGAAAIKLLMKAGIHVVHHDRAIKALVRFLRFKPKLEIIRMQHPGWADPSCQMFVRPEEVLYVEE